MRAPSPSLRRRTAITLAGAVVLAGMLAAATDAAAPSQHAVRLYTVERQVDLSGGQTVNADVRCTTGDIAVDGSWRADAVDQRPGDTLRSVTATASYPDSTDAALWHATLRNTAAGRAQTKVFVTCLGRSTEPDGSHQHTWTVGARSDSTRSTTTVGVSSWAHTAGCPAGSIAVSPGFRVTAGTARLRSQAPNDTAVTRWKWNVDVTAQPATITFTQRCLTLRSSTTAGHTHTLAAVNRMAPAAVSLAGNSTGDRTFACRDDEVAVLGSEWIANTDHPFLWLHGGDPRGKTRAYRLQNTGPTARFVQLGAVCLGLRTSAAA